MKHCYDSLLPNEKGPICAYLLTVNGPDVLQCVDGRRQSSTQAEIFLRQKSSQRQIVKDLSAIPPNVEGTVLSETLVVDTMNLQYASGPVVQWSSGCPLFQAA